MFHTSLCLSHYLDDDRVVLRCKDQQLTGRQFYHRVSALSHAISGRVTVGGRVLILGENSLQWIIGLLAILDAGCIAVPINLRWSEEDVAHAVETTGPTLLMVDHVHHAFLMRALSLNCPYRPAGEARAQSGVNPQGISLRAEPPTSHSWLARSRTNGATAARSGLPGSPSVVLLLEAEAGVTSAETWDSSLRSCVCSEAEARASAAPASVHHPAPLAAPRLQLMSPPDGAALICFTSGTTGRQVPSQIGCDFYRHVARSLVLALVGSFPGSCASCLSGHWSPA